MSQKDFINGSIFEFKVPNELGFAYCKIFDFRYIREIDGTLGRVYNYIVDTPIKNIDVLRDKDWLFGARRLVGLPNSRGRGAWKFKGVLIGANDNIIPDFKYAPKRSLSIKDESTIKDWYVIKNIEEMSSSPVAYEQVKHLEDTSINSQYGIEIRTAMEFYRHKGVDASLHFDMEELANSNIYRTMLNVPLYNSALGDKALID